MNKYKDELVSIIMPSYNTGAYIENSIKSVIRQTYAHWELIIVDDCSTDNTDEIVSSINDSRIRYYKNKNNFGAAYSRNVALNKCCGYWVAFLDSDDIWDERKLEKQVKFMIKNDYNFSYTDYVKIDENGDEIGIYCTGPKRVSKRKLYNYDYMGCLTIMYNRDKIGDIQINDIKKNNDYALWLKAIRKSDCYLLKENLAKYRIRCKSISHDDIFKKIKSHFDLYYICDSRNRVESYIFALRNLFFGIIKKIAYEKHYKI